MTEPKVQYTRTVFNRGGIDIAIGVDVSKSMLAEDEMLPAEGKKLFAIPNRLNRARYCALNLISGLRGERIGVFLFASRGVEVIPLTTDYGYCQYLLKHINDTTITIPGSDLSQAILTGKAMLENISSRKVRVIILISDGEDITDDPDMIIEAARQAAAKEISIYTVGTGSGRGVLIPIRDAKGATIMDYYRDVDGTYLKTRLVQDTLKTIAGLTGGDYYRVNEQNCEEKIVATILHRARTVEYTKAKEPAWFYLSPVLLTFGLLTFAIGIINNQR
ncbi:MAG TPA: VWA domain-containing protein [Thermodesulfobacteriota bacterium]|nr:VWA domain-containing protein [Thermodesulfobacteriota bacterium]